MTGMQVCGCVSVTQEFLFTSSELCPPPRRRGPAFVSVPKSTGKSSFPEAQSGFINENHNLNYDNFLIYVLTTFLFAEK